MNKEHKCSECIWLDQCGCDQVCDMFEGLTSDEEIEAEYESDLRERHEYYMEQIEEQNA